jgi:hypothetical protein
MPTILSCLAMLICAPPGDQAGSRIINVGTLKCTQLADSTGPWTVGRNAAQFLDSCVQWRGEIGSKVDADSEGMKEWVIPIDSSVAYSGSSILTLMLFGASGVDPLSSFSQFPAYDFLCTPAPKDLTVGMPVLITGKILGWSMRTSPSRSGEKRVRLLVGVTEIRMIDRDTQMRLSKRLR